MHYPHLTVSVYHKAVYAARKSPSAFANFFCDGAFYFMYFLNFFMHAHLAAYSFYVYAAVWLLTTLLILYDFFFQTFHNPFLQSGNIGLRDSKKICDFFLRLLFSVGIVQSKTQPYDRLFSW